MTDTAIQHQHDQLKEQQQDNALITDGSIITIRSNHSSIADAYSDDADYDSLDTIAEQQQQNEKDVIATSIPTANQQQQQRRRRALTVTQNNRPGDTDEAKPVATNNESTQSGEGQQPTATVTEAFDDLNLHDQIHELDDTIIDGNQHLSDSDYDDDDDDDLVSGHKRHQSHRSTMSSIHSYVSSASNYDLLLARLGSKDTTSSTSTSTLDTPTQEIRNSFDRVYNDAVSKGEEDEIDWGKAYIACKLHCESNTHLVSSPSLPLALLVFDCSLSLQQNRILVKGHLGFQQCGQVRTQGAVVQHSKRNSTHTSRHDLAVVCKE